jgi:hypothetical protein
VVPQPIGRSSNAYWHGIWPSNGVTTVTVFGESNVTTTSTSFLDFGAARMTNRYSTSADLGFLD